MNGIEVSRVNEPSLAMQPRTVAAEFQILLGAAKDAGLTPEGMEKMLGMYAEVDKISARKAYMSAVAAFRAECPPMVRRSAAKIVSRKGTTFGFQYADIDEIQSVVDPVLGRHDLSYTWSDAKLEGGYLTVRCRMTHVSGHSEESPSPPVPIESEAGCSPQQKVTSAFTTARRLSLIAVTGIRAADVDDDGAATSTNPEKITEQQALEIEDWLHRIEVTPERRAKFLEYAGASCVADISADKYLAVIQSLSDAYAKRQQDAKGQK